MRALVLSFLAIFIGFALGCTPSATPVSVGDRPIAINDVPQPGVPSKPTEQMTWTLDEGGKQRLGDLQGKAVILDFWATYCAPCIEAIPHLNELQAKYGNDDLVVVGLNVGGEEDKPKVPEFAERLQISYILAEPEDALTSYIFGRQTAIPQTAIFDRNGKLVRKIVGFSDRIKVQLDEAVEEAVNSQPVAE